MECAQINVTGSGTNSGANFVSFLGAYKSSDPWAPRGSIVDQALGYASWHYSELSEVSLLTSTGPPVNQTWEESHIPFPGLQSSAVALPAVEPPPPALPPQPQPAPPPQPQPQPAELELVARSVFTDNVVALDILDQPPALQELARNQMTTTVSAYSYLTSGF